VAARVANLEAQLVHSQQEAARRLAQAEAEHAEALRVSEARRLILQQELDAAHMHTAELSSQVRARDAQLQHAQARLHALVQATNTVEPPAGVQDTTVATPKLEEVGSPMMLPPSASTPTKHSRTALHLACYKGMSDQVRSLLDEGHSTEGMSADGRTPVMLAAEGGHTELVGLLLGRRAAIEAQAHNGATALIYAAAHGRHEVVTLLSAAGASMEAQSKDGASPLVYAALGGHAKATAALLDGGADVHARSAGDRSVVEVAQQGGHAAVMQAIVTHLTR